MSKMIFNVEDKPRPGVLVTSVLQQLLANFAATITVPILIGLAGFIEKHNVKETEEETSE